MKKEALISLGTILTMLLLCMFPFAAFIHNHPELVREPITFNIPAILTFTLAACVFVMWQMFNALEK